MTSEDHHALLEAENDAQRERQEPATLKEFEAALDQLSSAHDKTSMHVSAARALVMVLAKRNIDVARAVEETAEAATMRADRLQQSLSETRSELARQRAQAIGQKRRAVAIEIWLRALLNEVAELLDSPHSIPSRFRWRLNRRLGEALEALNMPENKQ